MPRNILNKEKPFMKYFILEKQESLYSELRESY